MRSLQTKISAALAVLVLLLSLTPTLHTQTAAQKEPAILLTIFLRHDQSKTVDEINEHLTKTGWMKDFPPAGVDVVSWYVMMGIGQVVTLRVPPDKLREVNRIVEREAWGGYRTEFYATYDFKPVWEARKR